MVRPLLFILLLLMMVKDSKPEQIELHAAIPLSFDQFEPIDVPFQRASAPGQG